MPSGKRGGNPEEAGIPPRLKKDGYLTEIAFSASGRYPKQADKGGGEGCSFFPQGSASQEREGRHIAHLRFGHHRPDPTKGWGIAAGDKQAVQALRRCAECSGPFNRAGRSKLAWARKAKGGVGELPHPRAEGSPGPSDAECQEKGGRCDAH